MNLPSRRAGNALRFKLDWGRVIEGIDLLAKLQPRITQYYIGKVFYFADKEHLLDWGRPISGDNYVAMEHGPVPTDIYDILKPGSGDPDEIIDALEARVEIEQDGNKRRVVSRGLDNYEHLSKSDIKYLKAAHTKYARMSFLELRDISHKEQAYSATWEVWPNGPMDLSLWLQELDKPEKAKSQLKERLALTAR